MKVCYCGFWDRKIK